jgi:Zn-dependent protease with chaperone function
VIGVFVVAGFVQTNSITSAYFHVGGGQAINIISLFVGLGVGAASAFLGVYAHELFGNPLNVAVALGSGILLALLLVWLIARYEGDWLRLRGYRRLSIDETRRVSPLLQQVAAEMGVPDLPRFAMVDLDIPSAWTHMRHIVLSKGLLDTLNDQELTAVLAHELHHWARGDSVAQRFLWSCAFPIVLIYNAAKYISGYRLPTSATGVGQAWRLVPIIAWAFAWPSYLLIRFAITPAAMTGMRQAEYDADAAAVSIGRGPDLISALRKLSAFEGGRTGWEQALTRTHPPTALRIEAMEPRQADDADYIEPQLGIVTKYTARRLGVAAVVALLLFTALEIAINHSSGTSSTTLPPVSSGGSGTTGSTTTTPAGPTLDPNSPAGAQAATSVAHVFVVTYLGTVPEIGTMSFEVKAAADPSLVSNLLAQATADIQSNPYAPVTSHGQTIGCSYSPRAEAVQVRVDWTYSSADSGARDLYFTTTIPLHIVGNEWKVAGIPMLPTPATPNTADSSMPAGFTTC